MRPALTCLIAALSLTACRTAAPRSSPALAELRHDAEAARTVLATPLARQFVAAVDQLPHVESRVVLRDRAAGKAWSPEEARRLSKEEQSGLERLELDEAYYYSTRYGTPVSYALPLERLAEAGFDGFEGKRILDYGYGYVGHLRMLASLGAHATGVDADPLLPVLYGLPGDTGSVPGRDGRSGSLRLVSGRFPEDPRLTREVGTGYDLFLSKNTLKRGYVHPSQPVDPKRTLQLAVGDAEFVAAVFALLRPGGLVMLYNLRPAQTPEYIPWAEGETPFAREVWERAGFEVLAFDRDDTPFVRRFAHAVGWDRGPDAMDVEGDLFGLYLLARKPVVPGR